MWSVSWTHGTMGSFCVTGQYWPRFWRLNYHFIIVVSSRLLFFLLAYHLLPSVCGFIMITLLLSASFPYQKIMTEYINIKTRREGGKALLMHMFICIRMHITWSHPMDSEIKRKKKEETKKVRKENGEGGGEAWRVWDSGGNYSTKNIHI